MNAFTKNVLNQIKQRVPVFVVKGDSVDTVFSRVPSKIKGVDIILAGEYSVDGIDFLGGTKIFCYVVGEKLVDVHNLMDIDIDFFFAMQKDFGAIAKEVYERVYDGVVNKWFAGMKDEELVPDEKERASIKKSVTISFDDIYDPECPFFLLRGDAYHDTRSVIRYLLDKDAFIRSEVDRIKDDNTYDGDYFRRSYLHWRIKQERLRSYVPSADEVAAIKIKKTLSELKNVQFVKFHVKGAAGMIMQGDSVEGKDLVFEVPKCGGVLQGGVFPFGRLESIDGKRVTRSYALVGGVRGSEVEKITHRKKVLYEK